MSQEIKILYNNKDIFSGIAPVPFVSISQDFIDFGNKWNQITNLTLEGQLTGKYVGNNSFYYLNNSFKSLLSGFQDNYKVLEIRQDSNKFISGIAVINSIQINEEPWYGILPFTVDISLYEPNLFTNYYGVVEPEEKFSFSEEQGDILNFTHSLSAKGIVTQNKNAIQNAKDWVKARSGDFNKVLPILVKDNFSKSYLRKSTKETIDRFNGVYSIESQFVKNINPESPQNAFLNYTIDLSSGIEDGFIVAKINGSLEYNNINTLRTEYNKLNLFNICNNSANDVFKTALSSRPIDQSVEEAAQENKLNFSSTFNNDFLSEIINDYTVDIDLDSLKCIATVRLNTTISCKYGDIATRWEKVENFYRNSFSAFTLANTEYSKEVQGKVLHNTPISESISFDKFNAQIQYSAQFTNKRVSFNNDILNITSSADLKPAITIHAPNTSAFTSREHNIQNLACANRSILDISVTAIAKINKSINIAESAAIDEINRIKSNYIFGGNQILEARTISRNNDIKVVTINETWSFNGPIYN